MMYLDSEKGWYWGNAVWCICEWTAEDKRDQCCRANRESDHHDLMGQLGDRNEKTLSNPHTKHTHTHTPSKLLDNRSCHGNLLAWKSRISICLQELKVVKWLCLELWVMFFFRTFFNIISTIKCVRADTTASILNVSQHKKPWSIQSHTLTSKGGR